MQKTTNLRQWPVIFRRFAALIVLLGGQTLAWCQTSVTLTNASLFSLQTALASGGTVVLAFDGTITAAIPLQILRDTVVDASGHQVTLDGSNSTALFYVAPGVHFSVTNLTLAHGKSLGGNGANGPNNPGNGFVGFGGDGGSNGLGGALYNAGITWLVNCNFLTNNATGGNGGNGGSPPPGGTQAGNGGNGGYAYGGAIYNVGSVMLSNCAFAGNSVVGGNGGVSTNGVGTNGVPRAGMGGSGATAAGAALYNAPNATAVILDSTFNNNLAQGGNSQPGGGSIQGNNGNPGAPGGGALGGSIYNLGTNQMINSTFYANTAMGGAGGKGGSAPPGGFAGGPGGAGGDAYGGGVFNAGLVSVTNCTFAAGAALGGPGGAGASGPHGVGAPGAVGAGFGANIANNGGVFDLKNSILAYSPGAPNAYGTVTDQGYNISSDDTPAFAGQTSRSNLVPALFALNNNGGPTQTLALMPGSPAIDAIYDASAPPFDQRGTPRPLGARSDIGAFEYGVTYTVSGQITFGSNAFAGATVTITDGVRTYETVTDTNGNYSLIFLPTGSYTVTPQPAGFFTPPNLQFGLTNSLTGVNFAAAPATATITSTPTPASQSFLVQITFTGIPNLNYRVQQSKDFSPWKNAATNNSGPSGIFYFSQNTTNFTKRFFQAIP